MSDSQEGPERPKHSFLWRYLHEIVSIVIDDAMSCSIINAVNEMKNTKSKSSKGICKELSVSHWPGQVLT